MSLFSHLAIVMIAAICEYVCQHMDLREFDLQNVCTCEGCAEFIYRLTPTLCGKTEK